MTLFYPSFITNIVSLPVSALNMGKNRVKSSIKRVRVSSGSAIVLGLRKGFLAAKPTTAYLLTYHKGRCTANCGFCTQAKDSKTRVDMLSRVAWPVFEVRKVAASIATSSLKGEIRRICIQALNYPRVLKDILALIADIRLYGTKVPISVSCQPLSKEEMIKLREASVEKMGVALDAATREVFEKVKGSRADGPYEWHSQRQALLEAVDVFGIGNASTHLIVGLGEREEEIVEIIQWCTDTGVYPAIFAFTPIPGTRLEHGHPPTISQYRRIQLAHYLVVQGKTRNEKMVFDEDGSIVDFGVSQEEYEKSIRSGKPFLTSGCPSCNRPYYNEKPSGPLYNFPVQPTMVEVRNIRKQLEVSK